MAYFTGMRRGELLSLKWEQVNLAEKSITLRAGTTKNDRRRVVFMEGELLDAIQKQKRYRDTFVPSCPLVFFRLVREGGETRAVPITSFRTAWENALKKVGLEGRLFHDFRRTGVRNLVRSGVPQTVAMKVSGHLTPSVFSRYDITSETDLIEAASKVDALYKTVAERLQTAEAGLGKGE